MPQTPAVQDAEAERALLGAALARPADADQLLEHLEPDDFTGKVRRAIYRALADCHLAGITETSPAVVFDELGPDQAAEQEVTAEDLEAWALESPAAADPGLFCKLERRVRMLRTRRRLRARARELAAAEPDELTGERGDRYRKALDELGFLLGQLATNGQGPDLRSIDLVSAAQGQADDKPPWVCKGWLARGDVALLAGSPGVGKSLVLMELGGAIARAQPWLRYVDVGEGVKAQRVLYVDEENNRRLVQYRFRKWCRGRQVWPLEIEELPYRYLAENGINLDDELGFRRLAHEVDEFAPDWILLDSLVRFHGRNENDNAAMSQFFTQRLRPIAARSRAGVVVLHHLSKPSKERSRGSGEDEFMTRLRGASDLAAQVDQGWGLEEDVETGCLILRHFKCRWGKLSAPLRVEIEDVAGGEGLRIDCTGRADDARSAIFDLLQAASFQGVLRQDLVERVKLEGMKHPARTTSRHLSDLYGEGRIAKGQDGKKKRYWLREFAPGDAE